MAAMAPTHELCDGCGENVSRGTLRNILTDPSMTAGTNAATGLPVYRLEAFKALCARCRAER